MKREIYPPRAHPAAPPALQHHRANTNARQGGYRTERKGVEERMLWPVLGRDVGHVDLGFGVYAYDRRVASERKVSGGNGLIIIFLLLHSWFPRLGLFSHLNL